MMLQARGIRCIHIQIQFLRHPNVGKVKNNLEAVKKRWLPQVIMADDFNAAWDQYMEEYNACNPQIYFDYLQQKVNEN